MFIIASAWLMLSGVKAEEGVEDEEKTEEEASTGTEVCLSPGRVVLEVVVH